MDAIFGDVILYPEDKELSSEAVAEIERINGIGKGVQYTHAAILYNKPGYQFEAVFPRAKIDLIDITRPYEIWRMCELTDTERQAVLKWCDGEVGEWYALPLLTPFGPIFLPGFCDCSEAVCKAYASVGKNIGDADMSPDSLPCYPGAIKIFSFVPQGR